MPLSTDIARLILYLHLMGMVEKQSPYQIGRQWRDERYIRGGRRSNICYIVAISSDKIEQLERRQRTAVTDTVMCLWVRFRLGAGNQLFIPERPSISDSGPNRIFCLQLV